MADMNKKKQGQIMEDDVKSINDDTQVVEIDLVTERRVLRKIDRVVLPLMCFVFFFQCEQPSMIVDSVYHVLTHCRS